MMFLLFRKRAASDTGGSKSSADGLYCRSELVSGIGGPYPSCIVVGSTRTDKSSSLKLSVILFITMVCVVLILIFQKEITKRLFQTKSVCMNVRAVLIL